MRNEAPVSLREQALAVGLLLLVLGLLYGLLVHPLWVRPLADEAKRIDALQQRQARAQAQIAQAPQVQAALEDTLAALAMRPGFLPETSAELATAGMIGRLESLVQQVSPGNRSCTISNRSPLSVPVDPAVNFARVAVQVRLRCGMAETAALLHALEGGVPRVFVENLNIVSPQSGGTDMVLADGGGGLDVSFDLHGYLAPHAELASAP